MTTRLIDALLLTVVALCALALIASVTADGEVTPVAVTTTTTTASTSSSSSGVVNVSVTVAE
jgi:hypothetical protein